MPALDKGPSSELVARNRANSITLCRSPDPCSLPTPLEPQSDSQPGCYGCPTHGRPENKCYEKGHRAILELLLESSWVLQNDWTFTIQRGTEISETVWGWTMDGTGWFQFPFLCQPRRSWKSRVCIQMPLKTIQTMGESSCQSAKGWRRNDLECFSVVSCLSYKERRASTWKSELPVREGSCLSCSDRGRHRIHVCPKLWDSDPAEIITIPLFYSFFVSVNFERNTWFKFFFKIDEALSNGAKCLQTKRLGDSSKWLLNSVYLVLGL